MASIARHEGNPMIIVWALLSVLNLGLIVRAAENRDATFVVVGFATMMGCLIAMFEEMHARSSEVETDLPEKPEE